MFTHRRVWVERQGKNVSLRGNPRCRSHDPAQWSCDQPLNQSRSQHKRAARRSRSYANSSSGAYAGIANSGSRQPSRSSIENLQSVNEKLHQIREVLHKTVNSNSRRDRNLTALLWHVEDLVTLLEDSQAGLESLIARFYSSLPDSAKVRQNLP